MDCLARDTMKYCHSNYVCDLSHCDMVSLTKAMLAHTLRTASAIASMGPMKATDGRCIVQGQARSSLPLLACSAEQPRYASVSFLQGGTRKQDGGHIALKRPCCAVDGRRLSLWGARRQEAATRPWASKWLSAPCTGITAPVVARRRAVWAVLQR
jgi:hypothetical protein